MPPPYQVREIWLPFGAERIVGAFAVEPYPAISGHGLVLLPIGDEVQGIGGGLGSVDASLSPGGIEHFSSQIPKLDRDSPVLCHQAGIVTLVAVKSIDHSRKGAQLAFRRSGAKDPAGGRCQGG